jgi:hypothetical protein
MIISPRILLRTKNVPDKIFRKIEKHILCSTASPENRAAHDTMSKNMVEQDRPQITIQYGACALPAG